MKALYLALLMLTIGCGARSSYPAPAYAPAIQSESVYGDPSPAPGQSSSWTTTDSRPVSTQAPAPSSPQAAAEPATPEQPLVVYLGYLKLRVRRVLEAVDAITTLTEAAKGYVESQTASVIIVRIPATDFERVMGTFAAVGEVLDRRIKALDVTSQFTDLSARLAVAREARERLLVLLAQVTDVGERLQILQEVKRLTEQIESMESTLGTLENLVSFFTITIELVPVLDDRRQVAHVSPFPWVRALTAHATTVSDGKGRFAVDLPRGFVEFTEDDAFRAQAADTTTLRAAVVDNEPAGDSAFWVAAIEHEMEGRDEELVAKSDAGRLSVRVFRNKDVEPRYYLVGAYALGDSLFVVEVFFPTEAAWHAHEGEVMGALATFRAAD